MDSSHLPNCSEPDNLAPCQSCAPGEFLCSHPIVATVCSGSGIDTTEEGNIGVTQEGSVEITQEIGVAITQESVIEMH